MSGCGRTNHLSDAAASEQPYQLAYTAFCTYLAAYITQRESHWIEALSAVETGFNTVRPAGTSDLDQKALPLADPA
ncbi:hypothetical protein DV532_15460 [Pseudomonas sp. Leaf58]|uniref:hypothetical protein n=1 Tax=Pseudomonas sp. Leaf58 TaxID=1736226 RepID=UPI0006F8F445|nr:hypothetical protein [Pseudomonas sp. Leaf58]AYG45620.1 hypothetical protein DV532_15460 [Pseudomonas sp. Leaf58]KQN58830.1 hypothetical protein ASF02_18255 [Pseudomonas sp. Leaf58]